MTWRKFGFHCTSTGQLNGIGDYIAKLRTAAKPVFLQSTDSAGVIFQACELGSHPQDGLVFRRTVSDDPNTGTRIDRLPEMNEAYIGDPVQIAASRYQLLDDMYPPELRPYKKRIWRVMINEPSKEVANYDYLGKFALEGGRLAIAADEKVAAFGWSGGTPERGFWESPYVLEYLQMCAAHPDNVGISLHEYSLDEDSIKTDYPYQLGRFQVLHDVCDAHGIARPTIHIGEFGAGEKYWNGSIGEKMAEVEWAQGLYAPHDNILGACVWTLGEWGGKIVEQMLGMVAPVTDAAVAYPYSPPSPVDPPTIPDDGTTAEKIFNLSQSWAFPVNEDAALQAAALADVFTPSGEERWGVVDGVKYAMQPFYKIGDTNSKRSYYAIVGDWGNVKWTDGTGDLPATILLDVPHMSQNGEGASARRNDCGAACVAMIVNGQTGNAPSVDDVAIAYQDPANSYMSFNQLDMALNGYGMNGTHQRPYGADEITQDIVAGYPVIALVDYKSLPYQFSAFDGSHFIVIYGMVGEEFLYRDPISLSGNQLLITAQQLNSAMNNVTNEGNAPMQGMWTAVKETTTPPPPTGHQVATAPYFQPAGDVGVYAVFHFDGGKTQPQQMIRNENGRIIMYKGEGQWIGNRLMQDYEEWSVGSFGVRKYVDTSDAGNGGRDAYTLHGEVWIPATVRVGSVYTSSPLVSRFDRIGCAVHSNERTTDYLYVREVIPHWVSPKNPAISFDDVLVVEWRKTADINTPPAEVYKFAKGVGYVAWGGEGRDGAAVGELPQGRQPLSGELTSCV